MIVRTLVKIIQYVGVFPVVFEENVNTDWNCFEIKISKWLLMVFLMQLGMLAIRICELILRLQYGTVVAIIMTIVDCTWVMISIATSMGRWREVILCLQQASALLARNSYKPSMRRSHRLVFAVVFSQFLNCAVLEMYFYFEPESLVLLISVSHIAKFTTELIPMMVNCFILILLHVTQISYADINWRISNAAKGRSNKFTFIPSELRELRNKHWNTGNLLLAVNSTFGVDILVFICYTFMELVLLLYYVYCYSLISEIMLRKENWVRLLHSTSLNLTLLANMFILCSMSAEVDAERKKTFVLLHRLLLRKSDHMTKAERSQVRVFQNQIRTKRIRLLPCHLFRLDRELFFGMVMQVISYFILLVQFRIFQ